MSAAREIRPAIPQGNGPVEKTPVRLAIVGSGNIAAVHAAAISRVPEAQLVAVCSRNLEKAAQLASPAQAMALGSLEDLLAADVAEAFLIATPSGAHAASVLPALQAGRHVLCEKPLEVQTSQVSEMIAEAGRRGLILAGFFPLRYGVGAVALRHAVEAGRLGRMTFLSARVKWWRNQDYYASSSWRGTWSLDGGGALMNQGIHAVDLFQWLGGEVAEVSAYSGTLAHAGIEVEDTLAACVRFKSGALGTIEASTACYPGLDLRLEVSGDRGTAILVNDRIESWNFAESMPGDDAIRSGHQGGVIRGGASDPQAITCEGHRQQIAEFCRAIRGEAAMLIDGREAGKAIAIVEAAYRSANSRKPEVIDYTL